MLGGTVGTAADMRIQLDPPGQREFILDRGQLLDGETEAKLRATCDKLLTDKAIPIIIVTINSMADHGGAGLRIETFARLLFDQWGIGHAELKSGSGGKSFSWNNGILLLVSKEDRKARIELGADWGREKDQLCKQIMDQRIVPKFKQGDYSGGISTGVEALDAMAREKELPKVPRPWWHYALVVGFIGLAIFTVVSMIRRGSSGWAWLFWAAAFSLLGYLLYNILSSSMRGGSGGFGGGSFGGGFSGGGGASGSW
jgi:uncharacterized protein